MHSMDGIYYSHPILQESITGTYATTDSEYEGHILSYLSPSLELKL